MSTQWWWREVGVRQAWNTEGCAFSRLWNVSRWPGSVCRRGEREEREERGEREERREREERERREEREGSEGRERRERREGRERRERREGSRHTGCQCTSILVKIIQTFTNNNFHLHMNKCMKITASNNL